MGRFGAGSPRDSARIGECTPIGDFSNIRVIAADITGGAGRDERLHAAGQLAKRANVNLETLRYYETQGLIPTLPEETLSRLAFIRNARLCGYSTKEIRKALTLSEAGMVGAEAFAASIDRKLAEIEGGSLGWSAPAPC